MLIGLLGDAVYVRRHVVQLLPAVLNKQTFGIQRLADLPIEWIDGDADLARVRVDVVAAEAVAEVVEQCGLVQVV